MAKNDAAQRVESCFWEVMPPVSRNYTPKVPTFLRAWREHRGISQKDAADCLEMDKSSLSRLERGLTPYDQRHLETLAALYRCAPGDLLSVDPLLKDELGLVIDRIRQANTETREMAVNALKGMLKIN
jgi:transcriptional regulator with XRE-family HTH domain